MADIKPFKGLRYNLKQVKPEDVITLPYDKISPQLQEEYYNRSPYNFVRLILGKTEATDNPEINKYTRARDHFVLWQSQAILVPESKEAIYRYDQHYTIPGTDIQKVRRAFIALGKLEEFASGKVLPHERTLAKPKEDRLNLLSATKANFGLIFVLYDDPENKVNQLLSAVNGDPSVLDFMDDQKVQNRLWPVTQAETIQQIQAVMKDKILFIADGHHRYETALAMMRQKPEYDHVIMAFVNLAEEGLTVLPTHRLINHIPDWEPQAFLKKCEKHYKVEEIDSLNQIKTMEHTLGLVIKDHPVYALKLKSDQSILDLQKEGIPKEVAKLDVFLLQRYLLQEGLGLTSEDISHKDKVNFCRSPERALQEVREGRCQASFLLNPTEVEDVKAVCLAGHVMPQKSTDFFPKFLSGMVVQKL